MSIHSSPLGPQQLNSDTKLSVREYALRHIQNNSQMKYLEEFLQNQLNSDFTLDLYENPFLSDLFIRLDLPYHQTSFPCLTDTPFKRTSEPKSLYQGKPEDYTTELSLCRKRYAPFWGVHELSLAPDFFSRLQQKYSLNFEGFASPFNSRLPRYCSPFSEDDVFGSRGSFFEHDFQSGDVVWTNPPFTENLIRKTLDKIEDSLSTVPNLTFLLFIPRWHDITYQTVQSEYFRDRIDYPRGKYEVCDHVSEKKTIRPGAYDRVLFLLSNCA